MSVDTKTAIFIGVKLDFAERSKSAKRYDEITGKPYFIEVSENIFYIAETEIEINFSDVEKNGLELYRQDSFDNSSFFLGLTLQETETWTEIIGNPTTENVKKLLAKAYGYNGEVKTFLILRYSY